MGRFSPQNIGNIGSGGEMGEFRKKNRNLGKKRGSI